MTRKNSTRPDPTQPLSRELFLSLLRAGLAANEIRFTREAALQWLAVYPGDLEVRYLNGQAVYRVRGPNHALSIAEELAELDPAWLAGQVFLYENRRAAGSPSTDDAGAAVVALGGSLESGSTAPAWGEHLLQARRALADRDTEQAEILVQRALLADPASALPAMLHLQVLSENPQVSPKAIQGLAEHYLQRWPRSIQGKLLLAAALMDGGQSDQAVSLLHAVAAADVAAQIPIRMWGEDFPYRTLWPETLEIEFTLAIPSSVAAALGWNQLVQPEDVPSTTEEDAKRRKALAAGGVLAEAEKADPGEEPSAERPPAPEGAFPANLDPDETSVEEIKAALNKIAFQIKRPDLSDADGRFPSYVIFSSRHGLESCYGDAGAEEVISAAYGLAQSVKSDGRWDSVVLLADDPATTSSAGIKPARPGDAWGLKHTLVDFDEALRKKGEMIGAVLIVGGPEVVPFHLLPNPVDDEDPEVPSDNPYATRDGNYFIPEWPVGRLPGGAGQDPAHLVKAIQKISERYESQLQPPSWVKRLLQRIRQVFLRGQNGALSSFGYTAAAWRKASLTVFRPIGEARTMLASPPTLAEHLPWNGLTPARLGYYNLHGLIDSPEWFGQRDPGQAYDGPDYPVALRPRDVENSGRAPRVVFSEACFGAHIGGKAVEEAMSLKFIHSGTHALVGSTSTAYGSIASPLIAADLLGHAFWRYLLQGYVAGEALRLAKIYLAEEMDRRQGYLDGEDQKTLISFVLYGDPLAQGVDKPRVKKAVHRSISPPAEVKTICDRAWDDEEGILEEAPPEVVVHVKRVVEQYLPGMSEARILYSHEHPTCSGNSHVCPTSERQPKSTLDLNPGRQVVTLSKQVNADHLSHPQYARLTLDRNGRVIKLAVSR